VTTKEDTDWPKATGGNSQPEKNELTFLNSVQWAMTPWPASAITAKFLGLPPTDIIACNAHRTCNTYQYPTVQHVINRLH